MAGWTFLTNYGLVLTYIGRHSDSTGLEIARAVGITERAARKIVAELLAEAYIEREKIGRRNRYRLNTRQPLRHPVERTVTVGDLLALLSGAQADRERSAEGALSPAPNIGVTAGEAASRVPRCRTQRAR